MAEECDIDTVCTISRRPRGRGFEYFDAHQRKLRCKNTLRRIKQLRIPPMWKNVAISERHQSHVQAYGFDAKARKQYIYHPEWQAQQQELKFARLARFGGVLPTIRGRSIADANRTSWTIEKACAIATCTLDNTGVRIGNSYYAEQNNTYGLTTLRRKHLDYKEDQSHLRFTGKHGKERDVIITDPELNELIKQSSEQPGYSLFRYKNSGKWHDITSDEVNHYIRTVAEGDYTAKDFRTWAGTRQALTSAKECDQIVKQNPRKKFKPTLLKQVAGALGNTPGICEQYYIHPRVLNTLITLHENKLKLPAFTNPRHSMAATLDPCEQQILKIIAQS